MTTSLIDCTATEAIAIWERDKESAAVQSDREAQCAAHRQKQISQVEACVAAESNSPADAVEWRDVECHEGLETDTERGTARQFAERLHAEGWTVDAHGNLICLPCQESPIQPQFSERI